MKALRSVIYLSIILFRKIIAVIVVTNQFDWYKYTDVRQTLLVKLPELFKNANNFNL